MTDPLSIEEAPLSAEEVARHQAEEAAEYRAIIGLDLPREERVALIKRRAATALEVDHARSAATSEWMTLAEAAEWLGVHPKTLRRRIAAGKLPAYRIGSSLIRLKRQDVASVLQPMRVVGSNGL